MSASRINIKKLIFLFTIVIIILYGIILRVSIYQKTVVSNPIRSDALDYFGYAKNLSESSVYSLQLDNSTELVKDAKRPPGFPFFASFFYQGYNLQSVNSVILAQTVIQCIVLIGFTVILIYLTNYLLSIIISFLLWTHPAFLSINSYYLTESLFMSSLILTLIIFILLLRTDNKRYSIIMSSILGILLGVTASIRPTMNYYLYFIMIIAFFQNKEIIKKLIPTFAVFLIISVSWKIRNYLAIGALSDDHLMINALFHGSYPDFMYNNDPETYGLPYHFDPLQKQYYNGIGTTINLIFKRFIQDPLLYLKWYLAGKHYYLWRWDVFSLSGDVFLYKIDSSPLLYNKDLIVLHSFQKFLNFIVMPIGVIYSYFIIIVGILKKHIFNYKHIAASFIVYASLFHIIVAPYPRYGIPFKLFVIFMFVIFINSIAQISYKKYEKRLKL